METPGTGPLGKFPEQIGVRRVAFENLLRPGRINRMYMRNRIIAGPMEKSMADHDGSLNERYIAYSAERARGGAALITLESAYVSPEGRGNPYQVGCHADHVLPGLRRMAEAVREHGANLAMELNHGGRQSSAAVHHRRPLAPSPIASSFMDAASHPREMTRDDIRRVTADFARAAERCLRAGVDMIHLHGAHGYLLGQFLSPRSNQRRDDYGGSLENRARFALEVLAAVREVTGPDYPIGYRLSAEEYVTGGLEAEESARFAVMLARAGIDLIDVAGGSYESMAKIFPGPETGPGGFLREAAVIRRALGGRTPVSVAGRMNDPVFAQEAMERDGFEFVTIARGFHADPHYVRRLEEGGPQAILPCIGCNTCVNLTVGRTPAGCAANPQSAFEGTRAFLPTAEGRRVVVAGGGPAGLHAARFLGMSGQRVILLEASERLGGQLRYLERAAAEYGALADWLERELDRLGVETRTGTPAAASGIAALEPDAVVVATGAEGGRPAARMENVSRSLPLLNLFQALERPADQWRGEAVILGGGYAECVVAAHLRRLGTAVRVVEPGGALASDGEFNGLLLAMELEADPGVEIYLESTAEAVIGEQALVQNRGEEFTLSAGAVVVGGRIPRNRLYEELLRAGAPAEVYAIGDAVRPRDLYAAGQEAAQAAERITLGARRPAP